MHVNIYVAFSLPASFFLFPFPLSASSITQVPSHFPTQLPPSLTRSPFVGVSPREIAGGLANAFGPREHGTRDLDFESVSMFPLCKYQRKDFVNRWWCLVLSDVAKFFGLNFSELLRFHCFRMVLHNIYIIYTHTHSHTLDNISQDLKDPGCCAWWRCLDT